VEISCENVWWNHSSIGRDFRQFIGDLVIPACDVVELKAVKLVFKAPYLFTVGFHLEITVARVLHDLVNYELRITSNIEVSDP
jgi:hypothetical protein